MGADQVNRSRADFLCQSDLRGAARRGDLLAPSVPSVRLGDSPSRIAHGAAEGSRPGELRGLEAS